MSEHDQNQDQEVNGDTEVQDNKDEFSLVLKEIVIPITGKDGIIRDHILRELDGDARDNYVNLMIGKAKLDKSGRPVGVGDVRGLESSLLSKMLLLKENGAYVPQAQIQKWPAAMRSRLYEKALKLCGLDKAAEENAKNS